MRSVEIKVERFALARAFSISRGSKTEAEVVTCTIRDGSLEGRGECVPYRRYGETVTSVLHEIEVAKPDVLAGASRQDLLHILKPGAARNAVDCALWDLEAKQSKTPAFRLAGESLPRPLVTAVTISLSDAATMADDARRFAAHPLLKVKVGGDGDGERIRAVAAAAPNARLILDANEGWTEKTVAENLAVAAECGVALIEQPLPAGKDAVLRELSHAVPICADESLHSADDLETIRGLYDAVNIKLDKTGGLTAALDLRRSARECGFGVMIGCMVGTSLAMAPALLLAQDADFVDLDGPLLLARDRSPGLRYDGSLVFPPEPALWG
ncbi:MAG TPA: N-acetyl-D-Glu racemase DgcA [Rhizobiaceae bacterium]|nr:N-acetyl-D-Glu racemase DgcA [Rhizobiaceae bacterium]